MGGDVQLLRAVAQRRIHRDPSRGVWSPYWLEGKDVSAQLRGLQDLGLLALPLHGPPQLTEAGRLSLAPAAPAQIAKRPDNQLDQALRRWRVTHVVSPVGRLPMVHRHVDVVDAHLLQRLSHGAAEFLGSLDVVGRSRLVPLLRVDATARIERLPDPDPRRQ